MDKLKVLLKFYILFALLVGSHHLRAQRFPIQLGTSISPPYSLTLPDFVEAGHDRTQLTISPLDFNLVAYKIKLKLVIESFDGSVRIETSPNYLPAPVFLSGGDD